MLNMIIAITTAVVQIYMATKCRMKYCFELVVQYIQLGTSVIFNMNASITTGQ